MALIERWSPGQGGLFNQGLTVLRGHLGVPDTVSEPRIVPLNYLVRALSLGLRGFQAHDFRN